MPLALAPVLFGISFGLIAPSSGMGRFPAIVFSATTFAGAAQFAAVSVLGVGGGVAAAVVAASLLNARYAPMSVAAAGASGPWWRRLLEAQLIVDESWALAGRGGPFCREILIGAGLLSIRSGSPGRRSGMLVGDRLGTPEDYGLDGAFAALFLGLALPTLHRPARACGSDARSRDRSRPHPVRSCRRASRRGERRMPDRAAPLNVWIVIGGVGLITVLCKAAGPVLLGGRRVTGRTLGVVELIGPVLLVALVVTQAVGGDRSIVFDARLAGVGAAAIALRFRAPLIAAMVIAAAVTALLRQL